MGKHLKSSGPRIGNLKVLVLLLLSLILAIASSSISLILPSVSSTPDDPPDYIYLTWATSDTAHTINVSWRTVDNYIGEVRYDNQPHGGDPSAYGHSAVGTGGLTTPTLTGYIHHVGLTGLEPDTIYYFICGNSSYGWSGEQSFRTAPDQRTNFRFATGGDSRDDNRYNYHAHWPSARDNVSKEMAERNPSFVLFLGDYIWSGQVNGGPGYAENDTWDNWLGAAFKYWRTSDNRLIPQIPVIGNHEIIYPEPLNYNPETDATNYYTVFNLPGNERWYALSWGHDLRIIVLDGEIENEKSGAWQEQLRWLESELENSENYLWKVVAFHKPILSSYSWWYSRLENWGYLFTKYGVDVVFQGHIHYYDRSYPIDSDPPPGEVAPPREGVTYIVSGGWGAPLSPPGSPLWYTAYGPENKYHFTLVNIFENGTLHSQAIDQHGTSFDEFSIQKIAEVSVSPSESSGLPGENVIFEVMVKNNGAAADNFLLENTDNSGWTLVLENSILEVPAGGNRTTTLTVMIPENAEPNIEDSITITATSQANNTVSDNDNCAVYVIPPKAELSLVTLYKVRLDLNLYLENGSKLVVKFYTYMNDNQGENVVWENVTPARVTLLENVPHPLGKPVENSVLVLTKDNMEVISTITSFTIHQSDLRNRYIAILLDWFAHPELHDAFRVEVRDILLQWFSAPP